jgi:hypothetical protein
VLSNEDSDAFEELAGHYVQRVRAADRIEYNYARELASGEWRLNRINALETRMLDHEMAVQAPDLARAGLPISEPTRLLKASRSVVDHSRLANYLSRQKAQLRRAGSRQNSGSRRSLRYRVRNGGTHFSLRNSF